jgi:hypothetical protein
MGLGIRMIWNDPGCPQQNGKVERSQGTSKRWAEPDQCNSVEELQQRLKEADRCQREVYPYRETLSRREFYPQLVHSGRRYRKTQEQCQWNLGWVLKHLGEYVVARQVDCSGSISIWNRNHYVGVKYSHQRVWVRLDPQSKQWIIADEAGNQLRVRPAKELTCQRIRSLDVCGKK